MATRFEIVLHGANAVALRAAGEEALDEIERVESQLSLYRNTSEIAHVNARAAYEPVRVTPPVFRLLEHTRRLSDATGGAFDITIAPLVRCWGFMGGTGRMPSLEEVEAARAKVGWRLIELDAANFTVRFTREGVMLDLGAIGKGYAIERAAGGRDPARRWRNQRHSPRRHQHGPRDWLPAGCPCVESRHRTSR
jgi:thiamine biosynthesis lipoprotein